MKAFVVTDQPDLRADLLARLRAAGFAAAPAPETFAEAPEEPALWLLDWRSSGDMTLNHCRLIRSLPLGDLQAIIALDEKIVAEHMRSLVEAGADDCLAWPQDAARLELRLATMRRRLEDLSDRLKVEAAWRESVDRSEMAVVGAGEGLWFSVPVGENLFAPEQPVWFSKRFKELLGFTDDEFPNFMASWLARVHPDDREAVIELVAERFGRREPLDLEYRLLTKQGEWRWFNARGRAVWDEQGRIVRVAGSLRDITEARRTADALLASEEKWRSLVAHAPDTITLVDPDGTIQFMNRNWPGRTADEMVGHSFYQLVPESYQPRMRQALLRAFQKSLPQRFEFGVSKPGGETTWYASRVGPIHVRNQVAGLIIITTDITTRVQAEEGRQQFVATVENSGDFIAMMTPAGRVLYLNPAGRELVGLAGIEQAKATPLFDFYSPPLRGLFAGTIVPEVQATGRWSGEVQLRRFDSDRLIDAHQKMFQVLHPESGKLLCLATITRDITDRKQAEAALLSEQELLRRLLDLHERERQLIAYEIHDGIVQEMTGALMHLEAAEHAEPRRRESEIRRSRDLVRRAVGEARGLVGGLRPPILDEMGVVAAIEYLINEARADVPEIEFVHRARFKRLAPTIEAAIFRIVQEALTNIRRHSGSRRARVELIEEGDRLRISLRDWGRGFDPGSVGADHFGLQGIRQRARLLGAVAIIDSHPDEGTTIQLDLPLLRTE